MRITQALTRFFLRCEHRYQTMALPYHFLDREITLFLRIRLLIQAIAQSVFTFNTYDPTILVEMTDRDPMTAILSIPTGGYSQRTRDRFATVSIAILFIDLVGSTIYKKISGDNEAMWWIARTLSFHKFAKSVIRISGGTYSKNIGDEVLAVFHEPNACLKALEAVNAIEYWIQLKQAQIENREYDRYDWMACHIGLDYGPVRFLYTNDPFGSPVDRAARVTSKAGYNEILLSGEFIDHIGEMPADWIAEFAECTEEVGQIDEFPETRIYRLVNANEQV